jgi:tetratricopeptide (TPR) repeat protein
MSTQSNDFSALRERGNQAFKQGHFQEAIDRYTDALNILTTLQLSDTIKNDLTKCYSNRSQCYINLNQYDDAIEDATRGRKKGIEYFFVKSLFVLFST